MAEELQPRSRRLLMVACVLVSLVSIAFLAFAYPRQRYLDTVKAIEARIATVARTPPPGADAGSWDQTVNFFHSLIGNTVCDPSSMPYDTLLRLHDELEAGCTSAPPDYRTLEWMMGRFERAGPRCAAYVARNPFFFVDAMPPECEIYPPENRLLELLDGSDTYDQRYAIRGLGYRLATSATPRLEALRASPDANLRALAEWALGRIAHPPARPR